MGTGGRDGRELYDTGGFAIFSFVFCFLSFHGGLDWIYTLCKRGAGCLKKADLDHFMVQPGRLGYSYR